MGATYRIRIAFMAEQGEDMPTVIEACDEYTEDAWNGIPDFFTEGIEKVEKIGGVIQTMIVEIPESSVTDLFKVQIVKGEVAKQSAEESR